MTNESNHRLSRERRILAHAGKSPQRHVAGVIALTLAVVTYASQFGGAASLLHLRMSSYFLTAGADLSVVVSVEPDDENRSLTVFVDSADYLRSSMETLEGADAARAHQFRFKSLPAGQYELVARLEGPKGTREVTTAEFLVGAMGTHKPR